MCEVDDVRVGDGRQEVVERRCRHHVRRQPAGQGELPATPAPAAAAAGHKLGRSLRRDVSHEARCYLCTVGGGGLVVNPLPDLSQQPKMSGEGINQLFQGATKPNKGEQADTVRDADGGP